MKKFVIASAVALCSTVQAEVPIEVPREESGITRSIEALFPQASILLQDDMIYTASSFEEVDYLSTFSFTGDLLWEVPFKAKILTIDTHCSWIESDENNEKTDYLFVLSQSRDELAFFLSCIYPATGELLWERTIYAPRRE